MGVLKYLQGTIHIYVENATVSSLNSVIRGYRTIILTVSLLKCCPYVLFRQKTRNIFNYMVIKMGHSRRNKKPFITLLRFIEELAYVMKVHVH